jgi:hypothetical protein
MPLPKTLQSRLASLSRRPLLLVLAQNGKDAIFSLQFEFL